MIKEEIILKAVNAIAERDEKEVKDVKLPEIIHVLAEWNLSLATNLEYRKFK